MHEMSLCESVIQVLEENAITQHFSRVKKVWLEIGALAGVELECMRFCFAAVTRDTLAEQAELEIIEVPGQAWCMLCARGVTVQQRFACCPDCGSYQLQVTGGTEMKIHELEVD